MWGPDTLWVLFSDSWWFCGFYLFILVLFSKYLITMQWWASKHNFRRRAQFIYKLKPIKIDFSSATRYILKAFSFLPIFVISSLADLQLPAKSFEEVSFSYLCNWDCNTRLSHHCLFSLYNWWLKAHFGRISYNFWYMYCLLVRILVLAHLLCFGVQL